MVQLATALPPSPSSIRHHHGLDGRSTSSPPTSVMVTTSGDHHGAMVTAHRDMSAGQHVVTAPIPIPSATGHHHHLPTSPRQINDDASNLRLLHSTSQPLITPQCLSLFGSSPVAQRSLHVPSATVPHADDGYFCFNSEPVDAQSMEVDQANDDDDVTSISPRSSVDESQGYKSDGSWDDMSNDSADMPTTGPLWPENAYRREMLDLSINKLQAMSSRPTSLRKSVLIFNTMKYLQDELSTQSSLSSQQEESGDEDLELDLAEAEQEHRDYSKPATDFSGLSFGLDSFNSNNNCNNNNNGCSDFGYGEINHHQQQQNMSYLWPSSNQVPVPHPWSSDSSDHLSTSCWSYNAGVQEYMDQDDTSATFGSSSAYDHSGYLFEATKRQCVSREIMASYELLNSHNNNNNNNNGNGNNNMTVGSSLFNNVTTTTSNTGIEGRKESTTPARQQSQFGGFFDPLYHEGLNDMDLLATLGLKDMSHTFMHESA